LSRERRTHVVAWRWYGERRGSCGAPAGQPLTSLCMCRQAHLEALGRGLTRGIVSLPMSPDSQAWWSQGTCLPRFRAETSGTPHAAFETEAAEAPPAEIIVGHSASPNIFVIILQYKNHTIPKKRLFDKRWPMGNIREYI